MSWTAIITALLVIPTFHLSLALYRNTILARTIGLPYFIFPFNVFSPLFMGLFETQFFPYDLHNWMPGWFADYFFMSSFKYRWTVKDRLHQVYGSVYLVVTPTGLECHVADAGVATQIFKGRFPKPAKQYSMFLFLVVVAGLLMSMQRV